MGKGVRCTHAGLGGHGCVKPSHAHIVAVGELVQLCQRGTTCRDVAASQTGWKNIQCHCGHPGCARKLVQTRGIDMAQQHDASTPTHSLRPSSHGARGMTVSGHCTPGDSAYVRGNPFYEAHNHLHVMHGWCRCERGSIKAQLGAVSPLCSSIRVPRGAPAGTVDTESRRQSTPRRLARAVVAPAQTQSSASGTSLGTPAPRRATMPRRNHSCRQAQAVARDSRAQPHRPEACTQSMPSAAIPLCTQNILTTVASALPPSIAPACEDLADRHGVQHV